MIFLLVSLLWIPFRASGMDKVAAVIGCMLSFHAGPAPTVGELTALAVIGGALAWQFVNEVVDIRAAFLRLPLPVKAMSYSTALFAVLVLNAETPQAFIYFRF
jgi:alginate O-acetyltransferase complex protein AlgI